MIFARLQMCIDDAFPHLMQPLLETLYPYRVRPTPSIAIARVVPGHESGRSGRVSSCRAVWPEHRQTHTFPITELFHVMAHAAPYA